VLLIESGVIVRRIDVPGAGDSATRRRRFRFHDQQYPFCIFQGMQLFVNLLHS
jgi:hypothetical protein